MASTFAITTQYQSILYMVILGSLNKLNESIMSFLINFDCSKVIFTLGIFIMLSWHVLPNPITFKILFK